MTEKYICSHCGNDIYIELQILKQPSNEQKRIEELKKKIEAQQKQTRENEHKKYLLRIQTGKIKLKKKS